MQGKRSPKGQKLLQFRDKLARLNGHPVLNMQRQKLNEISQQNKKVEAEISTIFDSISQYYFKSEQKILSISKQIIEHVHETQASLIKELETLKEKQLDAIKEDVDHYLKFKKKTKKLVESLEALKGPNEQLAQSIQKLKPFTTKMIQEKISKCKEQISQIDGKIQSFANLLPKFTRQRIKSPLKKDHKFPKMIQKSGSSSSQSSSYREKSQKPIQTSKSKYFKWPLEDKNKSQQSQVSEKQQNLIESDFRQYEKEPIVRSIKYSKPMEEEQIDGKTQKNVNLNLSKSSKLNRKQSHQTVISSSFKSNMQQFLMQLRENKKIERVKTKQSQITRQKEKQSLHASYKPESKLNRVKSQENLYLCKTRQVVENIEVPHIESTKLKMAQNITAATSINMSQNRLRDSKSSGKGDWATILKEQQIKYNEMRRKLKN